MKKLRLIKPWRLQTRRQRTGDDRLEMMCSTAEMVTCRGPQGNDWLEEVSNPRTASGFEKCGQPGAGMVSYRPNSAPRA